MKNRHLKFKLLFIGFFFISFLINAQTSNPKHKLTDNFINFFVGNWSGEGEFGNGKKISANVTFKMTLDSNWLIYTHTDIPPAQYISSSMWGVDKFSGQFVAYLFDNFQGHRKFSSNGWKDGTLILTTNEYSPENGLIFQHFLYEKLSEKSFKMTFEISKDGIIWKMINYLVFNKK